MMAMKDRVAFTKRFHEIAIELDGAAEQCIPDGDVMYCEIHEELAKDFAALGIGRDELRTVAEKLGQRTIYDRLRSLMPKEYPQEVLDAVTLLEQQIVRAQALNSSNDRGFSAWRNTTIELLTRFLGSGNLHVKSLRDTHFVDLSLVFTAGRNSSNWSQGASLTFRRGIANAIEYVKAGIEQIQTFGITPTEIEAHAKPKSQGGGIHHNYHGPVTIQTQANAADNAIQNISQSTEIKNDLRAVREILSETMEITGKQYAEALKAIEEIASESKKPETKRAWKAMASWVGTLVKITALATDVGAKLGPHMAGIVHYVETGFKHFGE